MDDTRQENKLTRESQDRCISCGLWGWKEEVGGYHDAVRDGRTLHACYDCMAWTGGGMGEQIVSDVVSREKFDQLLWLLAEPSGALHLEHVADVERLGFGKATLDGHFTFPQPMEAIGATFWRWDEQDKKLTFCCAEDSFADYVNSLVNYQI